jgi:sulfotransferase
MGGLPRSGSTLLTILLNQNPKIFASHHSDLLNSIYDYGVLLQNYEAIKLNLMIENYISVYKNMPHQFYKDKKNSIIIDKNRKWGTPFSLDLAKNFTKDIKIIYLYRPILEVLSSFVTLAEQNPDNFIDKEIQSYDFLPKYYRPINDVRCDWLMRPESVIDSSLLALGMALKEEYKHMFHIVHYQDLIDNTQEVLSSIYSFLGIKDFQHNTSSLDGYSNSFDGDVLGIPDLHKVRRTISKKSIDPNKILSEYTIKKYKHTTISMGMKN